MVVLGLTGSIGMGKSTTAALFVEAGIHTHDSDATVHEMYASSDSLLIENRFPGVVRNGRVDRASLSKIVLTQTGALRELEAIVHPYVAASRERFLDAARARGDSVVVLDIPLLFEIGAVSLIDAIVVVSAPEAIQRARVLARPGMSVEKFASVLARQTPDAEKRQRAHFVIHSDLGMDAARRQVAGILRAVAFMRAGEEKV